MWSPNPMEPGVSKFCELLWVHVGPKLRDARTMNCKLNSAWKNPQKYENNRGSVNTLDTHFCAVCISSAKRAIGSKDFLTYSSYSRQGTSPEI